MGLVSNGLEVAWHDPHAAAPPPEWDRFVEEQRLPRPWAWPIVRASATGHRMAVLTATIKDGPRVAALVTARFPGLRPGRGRVPLAGLVDVDCLASSSLPGIALAGEGAGPVMAGGGTGAGARAGGDPRLRAAVVAALRDGLRREYGARVRAVMFRQVDREWLPAVLQWPAVVREGSPIAVFRNRFDSFDGYLAGLSTNRRRSLRKLIRRIDADPQVRVSFTGRGDPPEPVDIATLCGLHDQVLDRHHHRWWLRRRRLPSGLVAAQLADPGVHRVTYHGSAGRLLAFTLVWDHPTLPIAGAWGGLAPHAGGRDGLWFHVLALLIRWCVETGRTGIRLGQGSPGEKRRMGCELGRQWAVLIP